MSLSAVCCFIFISTKVELSGGQPTFLMIEALQEKF